jgi:hypothetical protein
MRTGVVAGQTRDPRPDSKFTAVYAEVFAWSDTAVIKTPVQSQQAMLAFR